MKWRVHCNSLGEMIRVHELHDDKNPGLWNDESARYVLLLEVDGSAEEVNMARKWHCGVKHDAEVANNLRWLDSSNANSKFDLGQASKFQTVRRHPGFYFVDTASQSGQGLIHITWNTGIKWDVKLCVIRICDMIKMNESDVGYLFLRYCQKQCSNSFVLYCF